MAMTDPLGDMLTRIRNGQQARKDSILTPASKLRTRVLDVLQREGYIRGYAEEELAGGRIDAAARLRNAGQVLNRRLALEILELDAQALGRTHSLFRVAADVAFTLKHIENPRTQLRRRSHNGILARLLAVADAGEHITQRIGHCHPSTLTSSTS